MTFQAPLIKRCHLSFSRENIGGSTTLFVSDPELFSDVGREEGQFPESLKQAPFKLYNELQPKHQNRGVFFM